MKYLLLVLWLLGIVIYLRASLQAQGKIRTKLFAKDAFLLGQQVVAILSFAQLIVGLIFNQTIIAYSAIANLILTFLFYLQPTPRTTRKVTWLFIITNVIFALFLLMS